MRDALRERLIPFERRLRLIRSGRAALQGAFAGAVLAGLWILASWWFRLPHALPVAAALVGAASVASFFARFLRAIPLPDVARATDRAAGASDRLSSACELEDSPWSDLLEREAEKQALPAPRAAFPARLGRPARFPALAAAAAAALLFIPARPLPPPVVQASELATLKAPPELEQTAEELRKLAALDEQQEWAAIAKDLDRVAKEWQEGKLDKREALAKLGEIRDRIRKEKERLSADREALAKMAEAGESHELAHELSEGRGKEAIEKEAERLGKDKERDAKMAEALEKSAQAAKSDPELSKSLTGASAAARRGDAKKFTEEMKKAQERWKPQARKGREEAARRAAKEKSKTTEEKRKDLEKEMAGLDPETLEKLRKAIEESGADLEKLAKAIREAQKSGKKPKSGEESKMSAEQAKKLAEELAKMDPKKLKELLEKAAEEKDCQAGGS